jgi:hypothetical protein
LRNLSHPARPVEWDADVDFYGGEFACAGFHRGLNWYRNIDRNWELLAPFACLKVPSLRSVACDRDLVVGCLRSRWRVIEATLPFWRLEGFPRCSLNEEKAAASWNLG